MSFTWPKPGGIVVDDRLVNRVVTLAEMSYLWENQMDAQQCWVAIQPDGTWPEVTPTTSMWIGNSFLLPYGRGEGKICTSAVGAVEFRVDVQAIHNWTPTNGFAISPYRISLLTSVTAGFLTRLRDVIGEVNGALNEKWKRSVYPAGWVGP